MSKLLETLDRQTLIERRPRGRIEAVDIPGLLRRFVESYDVIKNNSASTCLAPGGASETLLRLAEAPAVARIAVTGSFAMVRLAPVAAPSLLMAYCASVEQTAVELDLLPADEGANVALLTPYDPVVWIERSATTAFATSRRRRSRWTACPAMVECQRKAKPSSPGSPKTKRPGESHRSTAFKTPHHRIHRTSDRPTLCRRATRAARRPGRTRASHRNRRRAGYLPTDRRRRP